MSSTLHTSNELGGSKATPPLQSTGKNECIDVEKSSKTRSSNHLSAQLFSLVDTNGLRCEVRSMRSVPHALYTLPSVARVVASYVRQLVDDFATSLLLCRSTRADDRFFGCNGAAGTTGEDEETYLLLRLCALKARQRRNAQAHQHPQQRATKKNGDCYVDADGKENEVVEDEEDSSSERLWDSAVKNEKGTCNNSGSDSESASHMTKPRGSENLTQVEDQLLTLFAAAEEARHGGDTGLRWSSLHFAASSSSSQQQQQQQVSNGVFTDVALLTPPLLSTLLRFKPLLRDMQFLAHRLCLPRHAWQHHQREWVCVYEDVSVTLRDRLARYRRILTATHPTYGTNDASEEVKRDGDDAFYPKERSAAVMPSGEIEQLWHFLWEVLGAAWRQRDRLWGAYRYLQGPRQLLPLCLNSQAAQAPPPGTHSSPILRDQFTRYLMKTAALNNNINSAAGRPHAAGQLPASLKAAHEEDCCAFGPFTSSDIGISADQPYVLRQPLAAALRLLRVRVPPSGRDALLTSTTAFAGFKYLNEPARRASTPAANSTSSSTASTAASPKVLSSEQQQSRSEVVPLFDLTEDDLRVRAAVPYLSPEVYLTQRLLQQQQQQSKGDYSAKRHTNANSTENLYIPVHSFSDDVWNSAVVVFEAALSGFSVVNSTQCHLSEVYARPPAASISVSNTQSSPASPSPDKQKHKDDDCASPDAAPPEVPITSATLSPSSILPLLLPTESVYADVLVLLMAQHELSQTAAHNFLYAALYHLHEQLKTYAKSNQNLDSSSDAVSAQENEVIGEGNHAPTLSPMRLAREWVTYLRTHYGDDFVRDVLAGDVSSKGLCWRRSERWNAFGLSHVTVTPTNGGAAAGAASCSSCTSVSSVPSAKGSSVPPPSKVGATTSSITGPLASRQLPLSVACSDDGGDSATSAGGIERKPSDKMCSTNASYVAGSMGSMSVLSEDSSYHPTASGRITTNTVTVGEARRAESAAAAAASSSVAAVPSTFEQTSDTIDSTAGTATSSQQQQKQQKARRSQLALAANPLSRPNSFASFEPLIPSNSAAQSQLCTGSPTSPFLGGATTHAAPTRLTQKLGRAVNALDTPLMPLFGLQNTSMIPYQQGSGNCKWMNVNGDAWEQLSRFLYHRTSTARQHTGSGGNKTNVSVFSNSSGGGGTVGKANDTVSDAADVDSVEKLLHLLYNCILVTLRQAAQQEHQPRDADVKLNQTEKDASKKRSESGAEDRVKYAAVNHPFLRGVVERGLLSTYMTMCGCSADVDSKQDKSVNGQATPKQYNAPTTAVLFENSSNGFGHALVLPSLNLYVPTRVLLATIAQLDEQDTESRGKMSLHEVKDTAAAAANLAASVERLLKQSGTLRTLIGDDVRSWEAARDASRRARASNYSSYCLDTLLQQQQRQQTTSSQTQNRVRRAQPAVDAMLHSLELSIPAQLYHTAHLRRIIHKAFSTDAAALINGNGGGAEQEVRRYLRSHAVPLSIEGGGKGRSAHSVPLSPFFAIPPTLRGVVWGCLLRVPSARKREAVLAHAVHRTAAKPSLNDHQLSIDVPRCHAYHPLLSTSKGSAQLQRLLKAWLFLHPRCAYWQGLDSVCAVLLTVSPDDEALVLAQLNAVVEKYLVHDESNDEANFGGRSSRLLVQPTSSTDYQQQQLQKPTMADQLHRLAVVLRYCDPLLAHYLFDVLGCTPELYAISWLLTLFSHSLPTRKVYLLWDLMFVHGDSSSGDGGSGGGGSACLAALCAAVMIHRRATLLSTDFSGCLAAFSSGASQLDVAAAVGDTRQLMAVLPPSVLAQPCAAKELKTPAGELNGLDPLYGGNGNSGRRPPSAAHGGDGNSSATDTSSIAYLAVEDLKCAWLVAQGRTTSSSNFIRVPPFNTTPLGAQGPELTDADGEIHQQHWSDSGVYLVDIREENPRDEPHDAVLGAIHLPLRLSSASLPLLFDVASSQHTSEISDRDGRNERRRLDQHTNTLATTTPAVEAAVDGWGIVEDQERLQARLQIDREAQERRVADAAAELVRHLSSPAIATIVARTARGVAGTTAAAAAEAPSSPWVVHPIVLKTSMAPHVVLLASGRANERANAAGGPPNVDEGEDEDLRLAHQLGLQLNAYGVHNVSILRGGVAAMRWAMPELVVRQSHSS